MNWMFYGKQLKINSIQGTIRIIESGFHFFVERDRP